MVAIQQAANAVSSLPNSQIGGNLSELADALASLQATPTDTTLLNRVQFLLNNLGTLIQADPALTSFVSQFQPLQVAANSGDVSGLLSQTTGFFTGLAGVLTEEADQQFTASLSPNEVDLSPGQGQTFTLTLTNTASDAETLNLSEGTLPSGVTVQLDQSKVTLAAGASTTVSVTLSQTIQSTRIFTLEVSANAGAVQQSASAVVAIRPAAADVLSVTATPNAVNAGDAVALSAQVFNTANAARSLLARVQILGQTSTVVATLPNVPITLAPGSNGQNVALGSFSTTGLAGSYNVVVSLLALDGSALPGRNAQTPLLVGIPLSASVSASATVLPPGSTSVTTTIDATSAGNVTSGGLSSGTENFVLYFTQYPFAVDKVTLTYTGTTFTAAPFTMINGNVGSADGLILLPNGYLLTAAGNVSEVNPFTGATTTVSGNGSADHVALDPSGTKIWTSGQPGPLEEIPLNPFSNAIHHPLSGDDTNITALAFDSAGNAYYTASGGGGHGNFGQIDLTTFTTHRLLSGVPAAHGISFDPYTGDFILVGSSQVVQFDPSTNTVVSTLNAGVDGIIQLDQGSTDGKGHLFVADNYGKLLFVDYSTSKHVGDPSNFIATPFLANSLDDVAPLSSLGALAALVSVQDNLPATGYTVDSTTITPTGATVTPTQIGWLGGLLAGASSPNQFQVTGQVTNLAPGEVRPISTGVTLDAQFTSGNGQQLNTTINLPGASVAGAHIISLTPPLQSVDRGGQVTYQVALTNPLATDEIYTLSTDGLSGLTTTLIASINVPAGQTVTTPLTIDVPLGESPGTLGFTVLTQTAAGASDSVEGELTVSPTVALPTENVFLALSPTKAVAGPGTPVTFQVVVTNTGEADHDVQPLWCLPEWLLRNLFAVERDTATGRIRTLGRCSSRSRRPRTRRRATSRSA